MPRTPREPGRGGSFSAAACRRIRHAATLAEEMGNIHSIKAYGVVWTFHRHRRPHRPGGNTREVGRSNSRTRDSRTPASSQERAAAHRARCAAADSVAESKHYCTNESAQPRIAIGRGGRQRGVLTALLAGVLPSRVLLLACSCPPLGYPLLPPDHIWVAGGEKSIPRRRP